MSTEAGVEVTHGLERSVQRVGFRRRPRAGKMVQIGGARSRLSASSGQWHCFQPNRLTQELEHGAIEAQPAPLGLSAQMSIE